MDRDKIFYKFENLAIVKVNNMGYEYSKNIVGDSDHFEREIFQLAVLSADGQRARLISDIYNMKDKVYGPSCRVSDLILYCRPLTDCNIEPYVTQKRSFIKQKQFYAVCNSEIKDNIITSSQSVLMDLKYKPTKETKFSLAFLKSNNDRFVLSQIQELNEKIEAKVTSPEF